MAENRIYEASLRHARHYLEILAEAETVFRAGDRPGIEIDWPNVVSAHDWSAAQRADEPAARLCIDYTRVAPRFLEFTQPPAILLQWLHAALTASQHLGRRDDEGASHGNVAIAYGRLGDFERSVAHSQHYLAIARETFDRIAEGRALNNLGNGYRVLGDFAAASRAYRQSLEISIEMGSRDLQVIAYAGLSAVSGDANRSILSIYYALKTLEISNEVGDKRSAARSLTNIGNCFSWSIFARLAVLLHRRALSLYREIGDRDGEAVALGNIGNAYLELGDAQRALELYKSDLSIAKDLKDPRSEGTALFNLSRALFTLGRKGEAIETLTESYAILHRLRTPLATTAEALLKAWSGRAS